MATLAHPVQKTGATKKLGAIQPRSVSPIFSSDSPQSFLAPTERPPAEERALPWR